MAADMNAATQTASTGQVLPQVQNEPGTLFPLKVDVTQPGNYRATLLAPSGQPATNVNGEEISTEFTWELAMRVNEMNRLEQIRTLLRKGGSDAESIGAVAQFGRRLREFLLGGKVGEEFERLRQASQRVYVQLYLPSELDDVPWEYMCEPEGPGEPRFLLLERKVLLSRGINPASPHVNLPALERPLRMLVIVSSPPDLPESSKLDTLRELRLLRQATAELVARGEMQLREVDEPSPENILQQMRWQPHIVHWTGHGNYDREEGGTLLMEDGHNHSKDITGEDLAELMGGADRETRLVVLSACRSGEASSEDRQKGLPGVGAKLVEAGVPAVVAMQESIRDDHASAWAAAFYTSLVRGWSVAQAMQDARLDLKMHGAGDWGVPVLLTEQPMQALFRFREGSPPVEPPERGHDDILLNNPGPLFVGRQLEQRRLVKGLLGDSMRIGILTGPGGVGKSSLAYRLYERTREHFWAAFSIDCSTKPTAETMLVLLDEWLRSNRDENLTAVLQNDRLTPEQKLQPVVAALERSDRPYLVVLDNFESVLEEQNDGTYVPVDPLVSKLLTAMSRGLRRCKLLITSRYSFEFQHLPANVEWVSLFDLSTREATSLMGQMPNLGSMGNYADYVWFWQAGVRNPRMIELLEKNLNKLSVVQLKAHLGEIEGELREDQMLDPLYDSLKDDAKAMLRRSSVYKVAVPMQFLETQVLEFEAAGQRERLGALLDRGLLNKIERELSGGGEGKAGVETRYRMHESTRRWAEEKLRAEGEEEVRQAQRQGAKAHWDWLDNSHALEDALEARRLYDAAGDYSEAGRIMLPVFQAIHVWGYYDLARTLLNETLKNLQDGTFERGANLHHLGILEQGQGNYAEARRLYNESLKIKQQLGNLSGIAVTLHQLGILEQGQGNYAEARRLYNESLKIMQQLGDLSGIAGILQVLGTLEYLQGNYAETRRLYNESLKIMQQLGDLYGLSGILHQSGTLEQRQGNYAEARRLYNESLKIMQQLGNLHGIANSLGQLGILEQEQGNYAEARHLYNESLKIMQQLGDLRGIAGSMHELGILEHDQGNYAEARRLYNESLKIMQQLGDLRGIATSFGQLGTIARRQGKLEEAHILQEQSLTIRRGLRDLDGEAISLANLGGIAEDQEELKKALWYYVRAYMLFDGLGSPKKQLVGSWIERIRKKIGEEQFSAYLEEWEREHQTDVEEGQGNE